MKADLLSQKLKEAIKKRDSATLLSLLEHNHPVDIVDAFSNFSLLNITKLISLVPLEEQVRIYEYTDKGLQIILASTIEKKNFIKIFASMHSDEQADLYKILSSTLKEELFKQLSDEQRSTLDQLVSYKESEVGSIMTTNFILLYTTMNVSDALLAIKKLAKHSEIISEAYVINNQRELVGKVLLRDILTANQKKVLSEIMHDFPPSLNVYDEKERAAQLMAKYDALSIPVVDEKDIILGIVTHDDALDVANDTASEDFLKLSATDPSGLIAGIKYATIKTLYQKRVVWLLILVFGNIFSGAGIAHFEETIAAYISLLFFLPLLIGSAGNAGSQSATLAVRALATGEVVLSDWRRMILKELGVATLLGLTMGAAVSLLGLFRGGLEIALVVALTMQAVVIVGSLIGLLLPFLLTRLKLDPATASAPLVASIADAVGVVIYFSIASLLLPL